MNENVLNSQAYGLPTVSEQQVGYTERKCKFGGEMLVNSKQIRSKKVQNCGYIPKIANQKKTIAEDLSGQVFGKLTVLYRLEIQKSRICWMCRCECGIEKAYNSHDLKSGEANSCGCCQNKVRKLVRDLSNQRFGRLVALYPTEKRDEKSCIYWHCRCDCGNEVEITSDQLLYHRYKSCGCMKRENQKTIFNKLHIVDGTCVEWLEKRKHRSDNKSGFRGVHQLKNGKYRVTIGFKKKRYYLGAYTSFEEAVKVRLDAEENLHGGFIEAYYQWKKRADQDPDWAKDNVFSYDIRETLFRLGAKRSKITASYY